MRIHKISRRNFMQITGISALAMGLAACGSTASTDTAASAVDTASSTEAAASIAVSSAAADG